MRREDKYFKRTWRYRKERDGKREEQLEKAETVMLKRQAKAGRSVAQRSRAETLGEWVEE